MHAPTEREYRNALMIEEPRIRFRTLRILDDRRKASQMPKVAGWLFYRRHWIGFAARWSLLIPLCFVSSWALIPMIGIPLFALLNAADSTSPRGIRQFPHAP